jgi:hypothetical protein
MRSNLHTIIAAAILMAMGTASAQTQLPSPVKTCKDVQAYIESDQSITMDSFKALLTASGADLTKGGSTALDLQCKANAYVEHHIVSQRVLTTASGGEIRLNGLLITDSSGVCKLTKISVAGC